MHIFFWEEERGEGAELSKPFPAVTGSVQCDRISCCQSPHIRWKPVVSWSAIGRGFLALQDVDNPETVAAVILTAFDDPRTESLVKILSQDLKPLLASFLPGLKIRINSM